MSLSLISPRPLDPATIWQEALSQELGLVVLTDPATANLIESRLHAHRAKADDPRFYDFTVHTHIGGNEIWLIRKNEEVLE